MRARRVYAVTALVLWLLGVEVLPNLHLAFHGDDHTHGEHGEIRSYEQRLAHALAHAEGEAHDHRRSTHGREAQIDLAPHGHAAGGIAHRAIALLDPPPPITTPVAAPLAEAWQHAEPAARIAAAWRSRPTARGPPV